MSFKSDMVLAVAAVKDYFANGLKEEQDKAFKKAAVVAIDATLITQSLSKIPLDSVGAMASFIYHRTPQGGHAMTLHHPPYAIIPEMRQALKKFRISCKPHAFGPKVYIIQDDTFDYPSRVIFWIKTSSQIYP